MVDNQQVMAQIERCLTEKFKPDIIQVTDESHLHVGHAGAQPGKGHYVLTISSEVLRGQTRVRQHRMIYEVLDNLMGVSIHALKIKVLDC